MNIQYFKEFVVLAETRNYWEAAERLYLNQSTLSKHIKSMENDLGVPLFERTTRSVELTEFGSALLPYAKSIVQIQFEYSAMLLQKKSYQDNLITIGTIPSMAQYNITNLLLNFQKAHPESTPKVIEEDSTVLKKMLLRKKCELAFIREAKDMLEDEYFNENTVERIPYLSDQLVAVLPNDHPLSRFSEIGLRQLQNEKLCFLKENTLLYDLCRFACQEASFIPNIVFDSHHLDSILDMVTNGGCIGLLTDQHAKYPLAAGADTPLPFCTVKIVPPITTQISLYYLKTERLSNAARQFVEYFKSADRFPAPQQ